MNFYPELKEHMSPSAIDSWVRSRSSFIKSYFENEKTPETSAMKAGTKVHALIEAGVIQTKIALDIQEQEIVIDLPNGVKFLGRPDAYEERNPKAKDVSFVDFKTGVANTWKEKLPTDIKMKATAWLVWMQSNKPKMVHGYIEFIQMVWDEELKEKVPIKGIESEVVEITYTAEELESFTDFIMKSIQEVNDFYEKWLTKTDLFVNQEDVHEYMRLNDQVEKLEKQMEEVKERIKDQMEVGGLINLKNDKGTFYISEKKTYQYPNELEFVVSGTKYCLGEFEDFIEPAAKAAKKNFELANEPVSSKTSIGFRQAKK
jgi:hypothetical protein